MTGRVRRHVLATLGIAILAVCSVGSLASFDAAGAAPVRASTTRPLPVKHRVVRRRVVHATKRVVKHHKRKVHRRVVARTPRLPVTTTTASSTTSTTSTTVPRRIPPRVRRAGVGPRARTRPATRILAAQPVSAHHSSLSVPKVMLITLGLLPLLLLGIGLIGSGSDSRAKAKRRPNSVGIPTPR